MGLTEFDIESQVARASLLAREPTAEAVLYVAACVRDEGVKPRVHPNGFIQLDLIPDPGGRRIARNRLHVWPDGSEGEIPRQDTTTTIHDHLFAMHSRVLVGKLINKVYEASLDGEHTHNLYVARYGQNRESMLEFMNVRIHAELVVCQVVQTGTAYQVNARTFHETEWDCLTATLMTKFVEVPHIPRVLVPRLSKPDNTFRRNEVNEKILWRYISKALGGTAVP